jgi:hypothetical protein
VLNEGSRHRRNASSGFFVYRADQMNLESLTEWGLTGWLLLAAWVCALLALLALALVYLVLLNTPDFDNMNHQDVRLIVGTRAFAALMVVVAALCLLVAAWPLLSVAAAAIGLSPL